MRDELIGDVLGQVDGDGEADPLAAGLMAVLMPITSPWMSHSGLGCRICGRSSVACSPAISSTTL